MPVGCLGGGSHELQAPSNGPMDIIMTSSVLNTADQFAFMQQTLLMQIFRVGSVADSSVGSLTCPTCIAFSDQCCQRESGMQLFREFIEANLHYGVWDQASSDALSSLRYAVDEFWVGKM